MKNFRPKRLYYDPKKITILYSPEETDYVINSLHYNSIIMQNMDTNVVKALHFIDSIHRKFNYKYQDWKTFFMGSMF